LQTGVVRPIAKIIEGQLDWAKNIIKPGERKYFASSGLEPGNPSERASVIFIALFIIR
jgi:hypothetical protein